jgi:glucan 1,3-beta-glucosidase
LNIVRIPVGYWSYVNPWGPYTQGAAPYLDKAITWARKTRLKVIIDLHGAPKSQNGFDHSGRKQANPQWGDADSIAYTHQTLRILNEKYAKPDMQDVVVAIQPLNEPIVAKIPTDTVRRFYCDAFYNFATGQRYPNRSARRFQRPKLDERVPHAAGQKRSGCRG